MWTDNEMMLMMAMCFLLGFSLNWIIRTYRELCEEVKS